MELNEYQLAAARTIRTDLSPSEQKDNMALGLSGEAGELADHIKKVLYQGHADDRLYVLNELGDALWYIVGQATAYGFELEEVALYNINKLLARYPDGFSEARSVNRAT